MYSKWLINKGLTPTAARIVVLEVLAQHSSLTAGDIYIIANKISELKIGTIYRVLSDLEKYSLIKRVLLGQKKSVYKLREQKINCNIRDAKNGEVITDYDYELNKLLEEILHKLDGKYSAIDVILYK
jgi:Fe2+ or Zn2+ uptake regulation protein